VLEEKTMRNKREKEKHLALIRQELRKIEFRYGKLNKKIEERRE